MGITIHYRGRVNPKEKLRTFYIIAKIKTEEMGWTISPLFEGEGTINFERSPMQNEYKGFITSFVIQPHEFCEPFTFKINDDGFFEDRCKTQFAPVEIHMGIIKLLDSLKGKLLSLIVQDEGQYWEMRDKEKLEASILKCYEEILKNKEADPEYYGPVKDEEGRITDLTR
jgi:hypothetical protein